MKNTFFVLFIFLLFSIGSAFSKEESTKCTMHDILKDYLRIWQVLTNDEVKGAVEATKDIKILITKKKSDILCKDLKELDKINSVSEKISSSSDIKIIRSQFASLSELLIPFVKNSKDVYLYNCSMALDGKGAKWIQNEKGAKNPYFGKAMLKCGEEISFP